METIRNFIDGELVAPASKQYFDNTTPATGEVYSQTPDSDERDVARAVEAAEKAFEAWSTTPVEERAKILNRVAALLEQNLEKFALAECVDNGKPLTLAKGLDIPRAAAHFRFFAGAAAQFASESYPMPGAINYTIRNPIGVCGCISPWNLPLYLFTWKISPALAAGNTVVGKPSEVTPMTSYMLAEICQEAELPPGVLNIVHGYGHKVGAAISAHPGIPVVTFTGGTKTGAEIARTAAPLFKRLSLEMGGKNPTIVFADCNYEQMLPTSLQAAFANQGQVCLSGSRIFVERPLYDRFVEEFIAGAQKLKVGDPLQPDSRLGAVVSGPHMEKILGDIELARQEGGKVLTGGHRIELSGRCQKGWFVAPTVITELAYDCSTNQEEIFGPVVTVMPFESEDEVLSQANSTQYGLAASVWTENLTRAHRMANRLQFGVIWINCWMVRDMRTPFGGMKSSGVGREGGFEALRFFTEPKNVSVRLFG
ncbi:MAG: aldehyde dehydrogenase [bacterium]